MELSGIYHRRCTAVGSIVCSGFKWIIYCCTTYHGEVGLDCIIGNIADRSYSNGSCDQGDVKGVRRWISQM